MTGERNKVMPIGDQKRDTEEVKNKSFSATSSAFVLKGSYILSPSLISSLAFLMEENDSLKHQK